MYDVVIVGCGPVGALLANLLGQADVSVLVLERDAEIHPLPRAVHFDGETMRVFQAAGLARAGKYFDGWFPTGPDAAGWAKDWQIVKDAARDAGRDPDDLTGALYLTMVIDDDAAKAQQQIETYLEEYYGVAAAILAKRQACYAGPAEGAAEWLKGYADAGASHLVLRFAGDNERHMDAIADIRGSLGW